MWYHIIILLIGVMWAGWAIYEDFFVRSAIPVTKFVIVIRLIVWAVILGLIYWGYTGLMTPAQPTFGGRRKWW